LGILALKMKSPKHSHARTAVILLHQSNWSLAAIHQGFFKDRGSKALHKIAPIIIEDLGRKQYQAG
jgi:predicted transcriptional regulator